MLVPLFLLVLQTNLLLSAESFCYNNNGNYTLNRTYSSNLDAVLSLIPANIDNNDFYNASVGRDPDKAHAIALCRADVQPESCRKCIHALTTRLRKSCPNQRQAVEWDEVLHVTILGRAHVRDPGNRPGLSMWNPQNATSPAQFTVVLRRLIRDLSGQAAGGGSLRKVAAGNATGPDSQDIYALVQCTPDLSSDECSSCLAEAAADLPICCNGSIGSRVIRPSCNLRYETRLFYNETRIEELLRPPLALGTSFSSPPRGPTSGNNTRAVIIVVVSIGVCVVLAVFVFFLWRKRLKIMTQRPGERHENIGGDISTVESLKYTLRTIREATNHFSDYNKLGQGGFGVVYKGKLSNGQEVAVKRLSQNSGQGDMEFKNEVLLLAKLQHRNLVRLLGFCLEGTEKILIYEFVQNASLDQFIFDPIKRSHLDWDKRYKIIGGIARGILYLHEDSQVRIIHRDLKPSNVLLDGAMNPKIADFGMARLFGHDDTQGNTNKIAGTFGYMAPEYAMHGQFSIKSDVFSFGVLVLEIISGRKNNFVRRGEIVEDLLSFAWKNWNGGTPAEIVDPGLRSGSGFASDMVRCIHIGLLCVQENAADRPTMALVVLMLNSFSFTMAAPTHCIFYAKCLWFGFFTTITFE